MGLTQSQLAEGLFVSFQAVSAWERGKTPPDLENICRIAEFFGVSIDSLVEQTSRSYFIGVDSSGSKTEMVLFSDKGEINRKLRLEPANPNDIGVKACCEVLGVGIDTLVASGCKVESAFLGITGGFSGDNAQKINKNLSTRYSGKGISIYNGNDCVNLLACGDDPLNSIALVAGTGSTVFVRKEGIDYRLGGWGYLFDKTGSRYDIGCEAVRAVLSQLDGFGEKTLITEILERELGTDIWSAIPELYSKGKKHITSLSRTVFEAERLGDRVASKILCDNIDRLGLIIKTARQRFGIDAEIVAKGSLFDEPRFLELLTERTGETFRLPELPPIYGACVECLRLNGITADKDFFEKFALDYRTKTFV